MERQPLVVGSLRGRMLERLARNGKQVVSEEPLLPDHNARMRGVRMGPDGAVNVLMDNGKLIELTPK